MLSFFSWFPLTSSWCWKMTIFNSTLLINFAVRVRDYHILFTNTILHALLGLHTHTHISARTRKEHTRKAHVCSMIFYVVFFSARPMSCIFCIFWTWPALFLSSSSPPLSCYERGWGRRGLEETFAPTLVSIIII